MLSVTEILFHHECVCVCAFAGVCPPGSCFQMTPSSELSLDICVTHTQVSVPVRVLASVVASFLLGWDSVTSI